MIFSYEDIIDIPHHRSQERKHMSMYDRAAQFSPFAALTGYDDIIAETGRMTDDMIELNEDRLAELNRRFMLLGALAEQGYRPEVTLTYFIPDKTKAGGCFEHFTGEIKKIDNTMREVVFYDGNRNITGQKIAMEMIVAAECGI